MEFLALEGFLRSAAETNPLPTAAPLKKENTLQGARFRGSTIFPPKPPDSHIPKQEASRNAEGCYSSLFSNHLHTEKLDSSLAFWFWDTDTVAQAGLKLAIWPRIIWNADLHASASQDLGWQVSTTVPGLVRFLSWSFSKSLENSWKILSLLEKHSLSLRSSNSFWVIWVFASLDKCKENLIGLFLLQRSINRVISFMHGSICVCYAKLSGCLASVNTGYFWVEDH